ncbi:hypothetical protein PY650_35730 [Rhizobium calliandrae]|uniref:Transposase n=1 Tax=Rhizobium calliandrae TaxID=1312182 RepID=A0ABT7KQQ8_9HYPH|nr:hypothetical protein [Rhizobium calliandrae]MDL2410801.1 hypothetical protein [Rhizobium calliandrae]
MPNAIVQASAEGMPKFDRATIIAEAWSIYRRDTRMSRPTFAKDRRKLFARCLRTAWAWAKQRITDSLKTLQQRAAERVETLTVELMRIDARPWKMATLADRRTIEAEIDALRGAIQ